MHPSTAWLRASLRLWRRRLAFRKKRLERARRDGSVPRISKWRKLVDRAAYQVHRREDQIHARRPLRSRAWQEAGKLVGATEYAGHNRGKTVDAVIRYAQGDLSEPYCVDGVIWSYGHAGSKVVRPGYPRAVSMMLVPGVSRTSSPRVGDPVRFTFDHTGLFGGFYRQVGGRWVRTGRRLATHVKTREFNTSAAGALSSDANDGTDGVWEKYRPVGLVADYLRVTA